MKKLIFYLVFVFLSITAVNAVTYNYSLAQEDTTDSGQIGATTGANRYLYGTFTTNSSGYDLGSFSVKLGKIGSPTGTIRGYLFNVSSNIPIDGEYIESNITYDIATQLNGSREWKNFTFTTPVTLSGSTEYAIVIDMATTSATDYTTISYSTVAGDRGRSSALTGFSLLSSGQRHTYQIYSAVANAGTTPSISSNITNYYNYTPITLNLSASNFTNMSYILNDGSETSACTNCTSVLVNFTLVEGLNNFTWISTDSSGQVNTTDNTTLDTTLPVINNNILAEYDTYTIDGFNSSCSDTNLDFCNISLNSQNVLLNVSSFTFTLNGNISYNITAQDLAGNSVSESGTILVNPYQYFRFHDGTSYISNYTFGGTTFPNTYANFSTYNDGLTLGDNTLEFSKSGYGSQNFTFNINTSSDINVTYNVSVASLTINIKDKETLAAVTGENFTLSFIGPTAIENYTTTGSITFEALFTSGDYTLVVSSANYETEQVFFTYNDQSTLNLSVYVFNSTDLRSGFVTINVLDGDGAPVDGAIVQAKQWIPSQGDYVAVSEGKTSNGDSELNIILDDEIYKFRASKSGISAETTEQIITTANNGKEITITLILESSFVGNYEYEFVTTNATEDFNTTTNISTVTFTWDNSLGTDLTGCINVYRYQSYQPVRISTNCTTSDSATMINSYFLNISSYDYFINAEFKTAEDTYDPVETFWHFSTGNIFNQLQEYNLHYFIILLMTVLSFFAGIKLENIYIGTFLLILTGLFSVIIAPTLVSATVSGFLIFVGFMILWGATR